RPRSSSAFCVSSTRMTTAPSGRSSGRRLRMSAAAPFPAASAANSWPSCTGPTIAMKRSPGSIDRLSMETLFALQSARSAFPATAAMTSLPVQRGASAMFSPCNDFLNDFLVVERDGDIADNLAFFMSFPGNHENIPGPKRLDRRLDRGVAVADIERLGAGNDNLGADFCRILAPRIVVGHDDPVGVQGGDAAHFRPFAAITVPAAAKDDVNFSASVPPDGLKNRLERIG